MNTIVSANLFQSALDLIEQIEKGNSEADILDTLKTRLADFGVEYFMIGQLGGFKTSPPLMIGTYHPEWQARFFAKNYTHKDPTILNLVSGAEDSSIEEIRNAQNRGTIGWRIMHEATEFGIRDGQAFSISGANGMFSAVSFVGDRLDRDPKVASLMRLIGISAHSRLVELLSAHPDAPPALTQREKDVLSWVANGKTDDEIANILGIGESTVHMHIERAKRKLGVTKRTHAVVEALRHHQILI